MAVDPLMCLEDRVECFEPRKVIRSFEDPVLLKDDRVLANLLLAEERFVPTACYFNCVQTDIKPYMRQMVTEWMGEICVEQCAENEVFPSAVNYLDRYLGIQNVHRTSLQCLGAACLLLASKLKENTHISAEQLVIYTDNSVTLNELRAMESSVLQVLKWDLSAVTPCDFVEQMIHRLTVDPSKLDEVKRHTHVFIKFCVTDAKLMLYTPSMVAAGCVCVSIQALSASQTDILNTMRLITGIDLEVLRACQDNIQRLVAVHLKHYIRQHNLLEAPLMDRPHKPSHPVTAQSTTPTDVRDINVLTVEEENRHLPH